MITYQVDYTKLDFDNQNKILIVARESELVKKFRFIPINRNNEIKFIDLYFETKTDLVLFLLTQGT